MLAAGSCGEPCVVAPQPPDPLCSPTQIQTHPLSLHNPKGVQQQKSLRAWCGVTHLASSPPLPTGTSFPEAERERLGLRGLLPPRVVSMRVQVWYVCVGRVWGTGVWGTGWLMTVRVVKGGGGCGGCSKLAKHVWQHFDKQCRMDEQQCPPPPLINCVESYRRHGDSLCNQQHPTPVVIVTM